MTRFVAIVGACIGLAFAYVIVASLPQIQATTGEFAHGTMDFFGTLGEFVIFMGQVAVWGSIAALVVFLLLRVGYYFQAQWRQVDGAYARREIHAYGWLARTVNALLLRPSLPSWDYDPNKNPTPSALIWQGLHVENATAEQLAYALELEKANRVRALVTGDETKRLPWFNPGGGGSAAAGLRAPEAKLLAGGYDKAPRMITVQPEPAQPVDVPVTPATPLLTLGDTLRQCKPDRLIAGQNVETGELAVFNPRQHVHAGIVGSSGTGKSSNLAYGFMGQWLAAGGQGIVLDGKGGMDWSPWAKHLEWHESDASTFGDQINALYAETKRRQAAGKAGGVPRVDLLPNPPPPLMVVIEEYGEILRQLRVRDAATAKATDALLDSLASISRSSGVSLVIIDQYPESWSNAVLASVSRWMAVFKLGPGQGNKVNEPYAADLPPSGQFYHQHRKFDSWFVAPDVLPKFLQAVPASRHPRLLDAKPKGQSLTVDGEWERVSVPSVPGVQGAGGSTSVDAVLPHENVPEERDAGTDAGTDVAGRWDDVVLTWFTQNPQALTGPAMGISDLARAMCRDNEGDEVNYEAYKGRAHGLFHAFRKAVRLPGNRPMGVDISTEGEA